MKKILFYVLLLFPTVFLFAGCNNSSNDEATYAVEEVVEYAPTNNDLLTSDLVESIEFIAPESEEDMLFSDNGGMIVSREGEIFIIDSQHGKILRFGPDGSFLNTIGVTGRGPDEFIRADYVDFQPGNNTLAVYSYQNDAIFSFSPDGTLISKDATPYRVQQIVKTGDYNWHYLGFSNIIRPERVMKTEGNTSTVVSAYLPSEAKILPMDERYPTMIPFGKDMYIRETFSNNIHKINDERTVIAYKLDFGKFNIPEQYFQMDDPFEAMNLLKEKRYAITNNMGITDDYTVVECFINPSSEGESMALAFAIKDNHTGEWTWFNYDPGKEPDHLFAAHLMFVNDASELFFFVDPGKASNKKLDEYPKIKNLEVLRNAKSGDNYLILKCKLRTR